MARFEISLAADGNLNLHLPLHTVTVPLNEQGVALLRHILQANSRGATQLAEAGNPTQWQLDAWLKSPQGMGALQLAGDRKRHAAIKAATGVAIKVRRAAGPALADIAIDDLL